MVALLTILTHLLVKHILVYNIKYARWCSFVDWNHSKDKTFSNHGEYENNFTSYNTFFINIKDQADSCLRRNGMFL